MKYLKILKDPSMLRFFGWIEEHGGVRKIAESLGKSEQTFYAYSRNSTPNFKLMCDVKIKYPDLDLNWLATGSVAANNREKELENTISDLEQTVTIFKKVALSKSKAASIRHLDGFSLRNFRRGYAVKNHA